MLQRIMALEAILSAYPHLHLNPVLAQGIENLSYGQSNLSPSVWIDPIRLPNPADAHQTQPPTLFIPSRRDLVFYQMKLPIKPTFEGELRREEPHALANASITILDRLVQRFGKRLPALYIGFIYFSPLPDSSTELVFYVAEKGLD